MECHLNQRHDPFAQVDKPFYPLNMHTFRKPTFIFSLLFFTYIHVTAQPHAISSMSDPNFEALANLPAHISSFSASASDGSILQVKIAHKKTMATCCTDLHPCVEHHRVQTRDRLGCISIAVGCTAIREIYARDSTG